MLNRPVTTPTSSDVLIVLRASNVIGPVRSGAPLAVPVYVAFVLVSVFPVDVVHVFVSLCETAEAVNVPLTAVATPPPPWSSATASPAHVNARAPTSTSISFLTTLDASPLETVLVGKDAGNGTILRL